MAYKKVVKEEVVKPKMITHDAVKSIYACARCHYQTVNEMAFCPKCGFNMHPTDKTISQVITK